MRRNLLVVAVLVGLGLGAWWYLPRVAEPAVSAPRPVAEATVADWPREPALTLSLKVVPGSLPVAQSLFEDGAMIWTRSHPDGSDEQWLLTANGTRRYRGRDGREWSGSGLASVASLSPDHGTDIEIAWSSLLFSLVGVDSAHAQTSPADATNSNDNNAGSNDNGGGSNDNGGGSNDNGGGSNDNGAGSNDNGGGSNDNGAGSNDNGAGSNDNGAGSNNNGPGSNDNGAASNDNGAGSNNNGPGSNDSGAGSNDNGGGSNDNGGGSNDNGAGSNDNGGSSNENGGASNDNGAGSNENAGGSNDNGPGSNDNGNGSNDNGAGSNENGGGSNENGASSNDNGNGSNDNGAGSNENGSGSNDNGAGSNENGGGSNDNGAGSNENGGGSNDNGGGSNDNGGGSNDNGAGSNENGGESNDNGAGSNDNGGGSNDNGAGSNDNGGGSNGNGGAAPPMPVAPPGGGGSGQGDPHYVMADGRLLSTQHAGEFLALTDGSDLNIQVRQEPWANSDTVAGITAIAIGAGTSRVEVRVRNALRVRVDGVDHPATGDFTQSALNAGAVLGVWRNQQTISTVAVVWADGSFVQVRPRDGWIDFSYQIAGVADGSKHLGLLGSADGDSGNDLRRRDGLIAEDTESGRAEFIESWRLRADESRFDYADGESTASFRIADFPRQHDAPDATALATASARCRAAGVENPAMIAACALDLAMTGNDDLLASHQAGADHLRRIAGARVHATAIAAKPLGVSGPGLTDATVILNNELQSLRVGAGERRVFAIDVNQNDKLIAHAEPMECVDDYAGEGAGYQWFDANGQARSVAKRSCSDLAGESVPPGRYFIVVTGPATGPSIDVAFKPYLAQR